MIEIVLLMFIISFATQRLSGFFYRNGAMTLSDPKTIDQNLPYWFSGKFLLMQSYINQEIVLWRLQN